MGGGAIEFSVFCASALLPKKSILPTTTSQENRFYLQQLPKKGHFLKEMHQKIFFFAKKFIFFFAPAALYRWTPRGVTEDGSEIRSGRVTLLKRGKLLKLPKLSQQTSSHTDSRQLAARCGLSVYVVFLQGVLTVPVGCLAK